MDVLLNRHADLNAKKSKPTFTGRLAGLKLQDNK
jgi:hypothetical protein